jgi:hypothetical protein
MPTLREVQGGLATAILRGGADAIGATIVADGLTPDARVQVYRNHVFSSLTDALAATYPVVCRLVDRRFFDFAADRYVRRHLPDSPCLHEYGATFADFLADFPPCAALPYLADVARLEWAMNTVLHAEERPPMAPAMLGTVSPEDTGRIVVETDPAASWLRSAWPIDRIWHAHQLDADSVLPVDLTSGGVSLEIRRQGETVGLRRLDSATVVFRTGLAEGATLETAADAALAENPDFDLTEALRALLAEALLTNVTLAAQEGDSDDDDDRRV